MTTPLQHPDWMTEALCAEIGGDFWHPEWGSGAMEDINTAKRICGMCPVREQCLAHALRVGELDGIWGGLTGRERRKLRPSLQGRRPFPHGTPAGYRRHFREKSTPCDACRRADRLAREERRWTG